VKKKIELRKVKQGGVFRRKGERRLCMRDSTNSIVIQVLTGKEKGKVLYNFNDELDANELVTPVKVKIVEVK